MFKQIKRGYLIDNFQLIKHFIYHIIEFFCTLDILMIF